MAEALLLIAERGADARLTSLQSPRAFAEEVVRGLPGLKDDWRVLASLRDQYPRLMEAAPNPLLSSLERLLEARPDDVRRLFVEAEDNIFAGGSMHTGLLWGLETLAWSPEYLARVTLILAKLASLDPGGRMANRPISSLREIFLWWHAGTNATLEQRLASIDLIMARESDVGWALLGGLLPRVPGSTSFGTAEPRWRDFGDLPEDARTRRGQLRYASAIVDRALDHVGTNPERWRAILDSVRLLSSAQQEKVLSLLNAIAEGEESAEVKTMLWEVLREFIHQHRTFQDASWALTGDLIDRLEAILPHFAPDDPVKRNRWLFDEWLPDLPTGEEDDNRHREKVDELRRLATRQILQTNGLEGLVKLGTTCKFPGFVASAAMPLLRDIGTIQCFVEQAISAGESGLWLAGQISGQARRAHGEAWSALVRSRAKLGVWRPEVVAMLLVWWPDARSTWDEATAAGGEVEAEYWRRKQVYMIEGSLEDKTYQIERLIAAGRAAEALDRLARGAGEVPSNVLLRLFDATLEQLSRVQTADEGRRIGLHSHDIRDFLDQLRKRADVTRREMARREYQALPLLGLLYARGLTIQEIMAEDPNFFIDVLCDVFLPAHRDKSHAAEPTPEARARAQAGFTLLEGMDRVPGHGEGDQIDEDALLRWISSVRDKAAEVDRATIAELHVGKLLAHAPEDPDDGAWPHRVVRNAIEKLSAEEIDRGLMIERHNMRGVVMRELYEGGGTGKRSCASISRLG